MKLVLPLPYAYFVSTAIFRLILLLNITPEHTLHSRINDSITHNSTVICLQILKEDLYDNVNFLQFHDKVLCTTKTPIVQKRQGQPEAVVI